MSGGVDDSSDKERHSELLVLDDEDEGPVHLEVPVLGGSHGPGTDDDPRRRCGLGPGLGHLNLGLVYNALDWKKKYWFKN